MLNDVNIEGLFEARDAIEADPAKGIAKYGVALIWDKGVRATVNTLPMHVGGEKIARGFTWVVDEPPQLLGESKGPTPQEYLMSGVGACIMVGFVVHASVKDVALRSLKVTMTGSLDLAGFMNIREDAEVKMKGLDYHIEVDADADDAILAEIEKAAVEFSPNAMTVAHGVPVRGRVTRKVEVA
ncbi:OsmC family protein (plasmid) [Aquicoccus sp. G2-2]|uniref:OsmC family protein n=1 Tax=Aquicoccus sp. G2-2 TaxID=3092120 RepID=UPI002ADF751C|nr:OsmC family protein [Aquicoccus sp. G2-2]MEA1112092.1 OsmC family protein [Aquicoccus sp. G2-2]